MDITKEVIYSHAIKRIAEIFNRSIESISLDLRFGEDLKKTFVSDFKANEFDLIYEDIQDVADRKIYKELTKGNLVIKTVGDYCQHMVRCFETRPKEVSDILKIDSDE